MKSENKWKLQKPLCMRLSLSLREPEYSSAGCVMNSNQETIGVERGVSGSSKQQLFVWFLSSNLFSWGKCSGTNVDSAQKREGYGFLMASLVTCWSVCLCGWGREGGGGDGGQTLGPSLLVPQNQPQQHQQQLLQNTHTHTHSLKWDAVKWIIPQFCLAVINWPNVCFMWRVQWTSFVWSRRKEREKTQSPVNRDKLPQGLWGRHGGGWGGEGNNFIIFDVKEHVMSSKASVEFAKLNLNCLMSLTLNKQKLKTRRCPCPLPPPSPSPSSLPLLPPPSSPWLVHITEMPLQTNLSQPCPQDAVISCSTTISPTGQMIHWPVIKKPSRKRASRGETARWIDSRVTLYGPSSCLLCRRVCVYRGPCSDKQGTSLQLINNPSVDK